MKLLRKVGVVFVVIGVILEVVFVSWYFTPSQKCLPIPGWPICGARLPGFDPSFAAAYNAFYLGPVFIVVGLVFLVWPSRRKDSMSEAKLPGSGFAQFSSHIPRSSYLPSQ